MSMSRTHPVAVPFGERDAERIEPIPIPEDIEALCL